MNHSGHVQEWGAGRRVLQENRMPDGSQATQEDVEAAIMMRKNAIQVGSVLDLLSLSYAFFVFSSMCYYFLEETRGKSCKRGSYHWKFVNDSSPFII